MVHPISAAQVCAVVLAGGQGSRMGGVDKGLQLFRAKPLVQHALERLQQQAGGAPARIGINANRNQAQYASWGLPVWPDAQTDYPGPLAGFLAALQHAHPQPYLLTVPCDSPLFPLDLLARLATAFGQQDADIAMVSSPELQADGSVLLRAQPVFCLLKASLAPSLDQFMASGRRKIEAWTQQHHTVQVVFDAPGDAAQAFANANTLAELQKLENP